MISTYNVITKCSDTLKSRGIKNPAKFMADRSGVSESTIRRWLNKSKEGSFGSVIAVVGSCGFTIKLVGIH